MKRLLSIILVFIILSTGAYANELATVNLNGAQLNFDVPAHRLLAEEL